MRKPIWIHTIIRLSSYLTPNYQFAILLNSVYVNLKSDLIKLTFPSTPHTLTHTCTYCIPHPLHPLAKTRRNMKPSLNHVKERIAMSTRLDRMKSFKAQRSIMPASPSLKGSIRGSNNVAIPGSPTRSARKTPLAKIKSLSRRYR